MCGQNVRDRLSWTNFISTTTKFGWPDQNHFWAVSSRDTFSSMTEGIPWRYLFLVFWGRLSSSSSAQPQRRRPGSKFECRFSSLPMTSLLVSAGYPCPSPCDHSRPSSISSLSQYPICYHSCCFWWEHFCLDWISFCHQHHLWYLHDLTPTSQHPSIRPIWLSLSSHCLQIYFEIVPSNLLFCLFRSSRAVTCCSAGVACLSFLFLDWSSVFLSQIYQIWFTNINFVRTQCLMTFYYYILLASLRLHSFSQSLTLFEIQSSSLQLRTLSWDDYYFHNEMDGLIVVEVCQFIFSFTFK